jgi:ABC-type transport system involved in multi-copper enzyme maturation permease subunit
MKAVLTVTHLTLQDARRRRIIAAASICGVAFLIVFWVASVFAARGLDANPRVSFVVRQGLLASLTIAGLYATNFLCVLLAILLPVDTLSGEIDSGVMQTLASKPIRRVEIVVGKWFGHVLLVAAYLLVVSAGVLLAARVLTGYVAIESGRALAVMTCEMVLLVTASIAGGTRLSSVTNGVVVLGWYGIAFVGGWVEQIGAAAGLDALRNVGIVASLISPADALWRFASYSMVPAAARGIGPTGLFTGVSVPSVWMLWWAAGVGALLLVWAVRSFERRAL